MRKAPLNLLLLSALILIGCSKNDLDNDSQIGSDKEFLLVKKISSTDTVYYEYDNTNKLKGYRLANYASTPDTYTITASNFKYNANGFLTSYNIISIGELYHREDSISILYNKDTLIKRHHFNPLTGAHDHSSKYILSGDLITEIQQGYQYLNTYRYNETTRFLYSNDNIESKDYKFSDNIILTTNYTYNNNFDNPYLLFDNHISSLIEESPTRYPESKNIIATSSGPYYFLLNNVIQIVGYYNTKVEVLPFNQSQHLPQKVSIIYDNGFVSKEEYFYERKK